MHKLILKKGILLTVVGNETYRLVRNLVTPTKPADKTFQELVDADCFKSRKVQYYARQLGVSSKTLNNITYDIINTSAKTFIDEKTVLQIKRLIISTEHSMKEIAYMSGFSDPSNFYKYFKKFTGSTPELFRQAH